MNEYLTITIDENGNYHDGDKWMPHECDMMCEQNCEGEHLEQIWKPMSELGAAGWELVAVLWVRDSEATAIFKRALPR